MISGTKPVPVARFRADPAAVRVRVRRFRAQGREAWRVLIQSGPIMVSGASFTPRRALGLALREAEARGLTGIDLGLENIYPHPHGVEGIAARVPE